MARDLLILFECDDIKVILMIYLEFSDFPTLYITPMITLPMYTVSSLYKGYTNDLAAFSSLILYSIYDINITSIGYYVPPCFQFLDPLLIW